MDPDLALACCAVLLLDDEDEPPRKKKTKRKWTESWIQARDVRGLDLLRSELEVNTSYNTSPNARGYQQFHISFQ